jgi:Uma2 family endonuclease
MSTDLLIKPLTRRRPPREHITYAEFCARVNEQKADLINGEIIMASPARFVHENAVGLLMAIMRLYVNKKKLGVVVGSRYAMKFSEHQAPEPDIMFIKKDKMQLMDETEILGPADLVVEVISPGSRHLDFVDKKDLYALHGVLEYWLIDYYRQQAFFWKNVNEKWEDLPVDDKGIVRSQVIPGFWFRVDWLFADVEELDEVAILEAILAGDPAAKEAA